MMVIKMVPVVVVIVLMADGDADGVGDADADGEGDGDDDGDDDDGDVEQAFWAQGRHRKPISVSWASTCSAGIRNPSP